MDNKYSLDLTIIPKELRLLLEIMKTDNSDALRLFEKELSTDFDWELFLQLAIHHRVYPLIYSKLINRDEIRIPPYVVQTLYQEYKKNTFKMLHLSGEMELVSKLFTENQIRLIFLKGPVIAADIYEDISLRTSKDLDILVPNTDLKRAEELLLNNGYEKEETPFAEWKWVNHHISYYHPQKRIQIELHWRINPPPSKEPGFNKLWERKRISTLTSYPVYFLGKEDLILFLIEHGSRHGWFRLRWLADIDLIIRKRVISEANNLLPENCKNNHLAGQAFILASLLLNTPINKEIQLLSERKRSKKLAQLAMFFIIGAVDFHANPSEDTLVKYHKQNPLLVKTNVQKSFFVSRYRLLLKSNMQKCFFVVKLLFPNSSDTKTLRLPKYLHFLYFPLRPMLWAWRKRRKTA
ncbi:nucleotidyltransferase domain-containing protein [Peribacillus butanolivorans]|uniref:nucleotidyltransferase domain-containing protein n=1 Tax=Peribacillus butanolivorans TaxID=421767 RepID=UPI003676574F